MMDDGDDNNHNDDDDDDIDARKKVLTIPLIMLQEPKKIKDMNKLNWKQIDL